MSEEEIIDKAELLTYEVIVEDDLHNWDNMSPNEKATIMKGLLDLYNKEKEKNKELLEGLKYRVNYCKLLEKELYNNGVNYNIELTQIEQDYLQDLLEEDNK